MLLDRYRQLLTAYVDSELSSRQRRHVARLLRRSPEARRLLQQLRADAQALRQLPRPSLPADLTKSVLCSIVERRLAPGQRRIAKTTSIPMWMGPLASWAAAAVVLFLLGVASYLYFAASLDQTAKTEMAQKHEAVYSAQSDAQELLPQPARDDDTDTVSPEPPTATNDRTAAARPPRIVKRGNKFKSTAPNKPLSPAKEETALTDRLEMFQFDRVPDLLPVVVKVSDLESESGRKQLVAELRKDSEFRLELPCSNGTKALDRIQKAAQALHFGLIIGKQAQERMKQNWRGNYALYVEDLTPEELTQLLRQIGAEDRKSAVRKPAEAQVDRFVLTRMTPRHRKELTNLLGVDPSTTAPTETGPLGADPHKPLADVTARQVGKALSVQGGGSRPGAGKMVAKPPQHTALVLAYSPTRPTPGSEEIKHFLEGRKAARAGTLRIFLVLRGGT